MEKADITNLEEFIHRSILEDVGDGDHTSLACIQDGQAGRARLLVKQNGIIAGIGFARKVFQILSQDINFQSFQKDGDPVKSSDIAFTIEGPARAILQGERLALNIMQRMSGIATNTRRYADQLKGLPTRILDTRKTTPGFRYFEKEAVRLGGGYNHRMGLYDMIMIKDNHIDFAGGIVQAIEKTWQYLTKTSRDLKIEIEARSLQDVELILKTGQVHRIMLDNFSLENTRIAVNLINHRFETESSGMIRLDNIRSYAECGVDFISVGALTHQIQSLDLSLKAF